MDKKFKQIYYSDDDTGQEKCDSEIIQSIRFNKRRSRGVATETALVSELPSCTRIRSSTQC